MLLTSLKHQKTSARLLGLQIYGHSSCGFVLEMVVEGKKVFDYLFVKLVKRRKWKKQINEIVIDANTIPSWIYTIMLYRSWLTSNVRKPHPWAMEIGVYHPNTQPLLSSPSFSLPLSTGANSCKFYGIN